MVWDLGQTGVEKREKSGASGFEMDGILRDCIVFRIK